MGIRPSSDITLGYNANNRDKGLIRVKLFDEYN